MNVAILLVYHSNFIRTIKNLHIYTRRLRLCWLNSQILGHPRWKKIGLEKKFGLKKILARKKYRLKKNFSLKKNYQKKNFKSKKFVRKFFFNLVRKKNLVWKKYFGPKIILVKKELVQHFFWSKIFGLQGKTVWEQKPFGLKFVWSKILFWQNIWSQNNLSKKKLVKIFFWSKIFGLKIWDQIIFLDQELFLDFNFLQAKTFLEQWPFGLKFFWSKTLFWQNT